MKPLHIGLIIAVSAIAGGLVVKWQSSKPAEPAPVVATTAPAPAVQPESAVEPVKPAAEPASPSPFEESKHKAAEETRRKAPHKPAPVRTAKASIPAAPENTVSAPAAQNTAPAPPPPAAPAVDPEPVAPPPPPPPPPPRKVTLAVGTLLPVRLVEGLSTERNQPGDTFTATLTDPLVADGFVIAERGARLEGRVLTSEKAGRVKGVSELAIQLTKLSTSDGQHIPILTDPFQKAGPKTVGKDAAKVGVASGIGAAIGAIAGGGKGAGLGAIIGGAAGTGGVMATRGEPATLPTETRISFRLSQPVTITEKR